jgi:hypothetical protein
MEAKYIDHDEIKLPELQKFDMCNIKANTSLLFLGQRNTGKTTLVLDYLKSCANITTGTVISLIDQFRFNYRTEIPYASIYHDASVELLDDFEKQQRHCDSLNSFLVLDELLVPDETWSEYLSVVLQLLRDCQQLKTTLILTSTDWDSLGDLLIMHFEYVFITKRTNRFALKRIHKLFESSFDSYEQFADLMFKYCKNYACLVINLKNQTGSITDRVFWYRASKLTKIACKSCAL